MTRTLPEIIFFGTEDFSADSLERLIKDDYTVVTVVTKPDSRQGRGKKLAEPKVKQIAKRHGITVWQPDNVIEISDNIKKIKNRLGILVSYGKIIPGEILDLFEPSGIINVHPSLLPKYRGPSPIESAILNGDTKTGVTIMKLTQKMDAGPIYAQQETSYDIQGLTQEELYDRLKQFGSTLLISHLPDIISGTLQPKSQNEAQASYCQLIKKSDGIIDWNKSAEQIVHEILAYHSWPKSRTILGSVEVIIRSATAIFSDTSTPGEIKIVELPKGHCKLFIGTGKGTLEIGSVQPLGKKEMPIQAFLAGYKHKIAS